MVACDLNAWSGRHNTRQTLAGSAVDPEGFLDAHVEVGQILDLLVGRDVVGRQRLVELGLQFLDAFRVHEHVEEQGAGGVGSGVRARDQLGEGFGREFCAAEFLAVFVLAFHEAGEQVDAVDLAALGGFEAGVNAGDGDSGEVLDCFDALCEEGVHEVFGVGLDPRNAADGVGDFASAVEDFDGRGVGWGSVGVCPDFCDVLAALEHAEGGAEGQVADDVEGNVVEPVQAVHAVEAAAGLLAELVPLRGEHLEVVVHVLFELADALGAEGVGDGLALAGVLCAVSGVEQTTLDGDEGIVVVTVECWLAFVSIA